MILHGKFLEFRQFFLFGLVINFEINTVQNLNAMANSPFYQLPFSNSSMTA